MIKVISTSTDLAKGSIGVVGGALVQQTIGYTGAMDLSQSSFFRLNGGAGLSVPPTNVPYTMLPSGQLRKIEFTVEVINGASGFNGFFIGIAWAGSTPNPSSNLDVYKFYTTDGGTIWVGATVVSNVPL
jgi:hypothetical protein